jgi:hypothetical protein
MAFSGPLPRHTVAKADGESRTAPSRAKADGESRTARSRASDDNDGGASEHELADFTAFGQETLERIFGEAGEIECACASFERSRGMRAGSANLDEVKALMAGSANRVPALAAGEAGPLCEETRRDLSGVVEWADSEARHQANVGRVFGLRCVANSADGNCFFESLQQVLGDIGHPASGDSVAQIRNRLVDALAGAREQYIGFMASDDSDMHLKRFDRDDAACSTAAGARTEWARYLAHLRGNGVWANHFFVTAVPAVYGVVLNCFIKTAKSQTLNTYSPVGVRGCPAVYVYCNDRHYEAMLRAAPSRGWPGGVAAHAAADGAAADGAAADYDDARTAELKQEFEQTAHCFQRAVNRERREKMERRGEMERKKHRRSGQIDKVLQLLETAQGEDASMLLDVLCGLTERR